jgi:hypothetical protein
MTDVSEDTTQLQNAVRSFLSAMEPEESVAFASFITLPKPDKYSKYSPNLHPISLLSNKGKLFEKLILRTIQKHSEERNSLICKSVWLSSR